MDSISVVQGEKSMHDKLELFEGRIRDGHAPFLEEGDLQAYAMAESITIHVSLYQTAHKCLKISGSTAFPYENGKTVPPFSHCIIKEAALMVRSNPCHGICLKILRHLWAVWYKDT